MSSEELSPTAQTWLLIGIAILTSIWGYFWIQQGIIISGCMLLFFAFSSLWYVPFIKKMLPKENGVVGISALLGTVVFLFMVSWEPENVALKSLSKAVISNDWIKAKQLASGDNFSKDDSTQIRIFKQTIDSALTAIKQDSLIRQTIANSPNLIENKKWSEIMDALKSVPVDHPLHDTAQYLMFTAGYERAIERYDSADYGSAVVYLQNLPTIDHPYNSNAHDLLTSAMTKHVDQIAAQTEANSQQLRIQMINSQFSSWNGSHKNLVKHVKDHMNDPRSFKHVETGYSDKGEYILVSMKFRGKNAFGGVITNVINAKVDLDGEILEIE
jgi:hypothetical protein